MRATRWLLGCLAVLLVALTLAAWLVPPRLDASRYRKPLQTLASRVLGAPVHIDGPIRLRLLPEPVLVAGPFQVVPPSPTDARLSAHGLRLELALGPLLTGRIEARNLVLQRPDLRLPALPDARIFLARRPGWLSGLSARIEDGRVEAGPVALTDVNATAAVQPLSGDLAIAGSASLAGDAWRFDMRITRPGGDGAAGVDVSLNGAGAARGTALTLSGQLAADGALQGHVTARGPDLSLLLPVPALPFRADGRISAASGLAAADDLAIELGGAPARGALAFRYAPSRRVDLALTASRLDLDPWVTVLSRSVRSAVPWGGVSFGIDLSAEAATLDAGTLRGLRAAFDIEPGGVQVRELRATLPGDAALRLTGTVASGALPHLDADARLSAPSLRTTLNWLTPLLPQAPSLPPGVLRQADVSAHVVAGPEGVTLSRLTGVIDGGHVSGAVGWRRAAGGAAAKIAAIATVQHLDLDPWLALGRGGPDLDLQLAAQTASLRGMALAPLQLDMARDAGAITVRSLRAQAGSIQASAHFTVSADDRVDDAALVLDAPHLGLLTGLKLPGVSLASLSNSPLTRDRLHVAVDAAGTPQALSLRLRAELGDARIEAQPVVDMQDGRWSGVVSVRHPSARRFLDAIRLPIGPVDWIGEGSLSLRAQCSGDLATLALDRFDLAAGGLHATGTLSASWSGRPGLSGEVDADTLPLPAMTRREADAVLLGGAPAWDLDLRVRAGRIVIGGAEVLAPFSAALTLSDGAARIDGIKAGLAGGTMQADASLDLAAEPPQLHIQGELDDAAIAGPLSGLPVDLVSGRLGMKVALSAGGHSVAALLSTLRGSVSGSLTGGVVRGVSLGALPPDLPAAAIGAALAGGSTPVATGAFAATLEHGVATLTKGTLQAAGGSLTLGGSFDLGQEAADLLLDFRPSANGAPVIGLRLEGPIGRVQRIPQLAALAQWRATRAVQ